MKVMIVGATSAIAHETARCFAKNGSDLFLVGMPASRLAAIRDDLKARGAPRVEVFELDLVRMDRHQELFDAALAAFGDLDALLIAHGTLGDQLASQQSAAETLKQLEINFISAISILTIAANYFEKQRKGCIAVISSVAGDRGRPSNYVYGTAKGGLTVFLQGLRSRLFKAGVAVVTIKPGLVDTPMTAGLKKNALYASAQRVGSGIYDAMLKRRATAYLPWFWQFVMLIIRNMPEPIFKRLNM